MTPTKPLKTISLIQIGVLWVKKNLWQYGRKVHAKFWPWGTICVFYINPQTPNIENFDVYGGLQILGGISFVVSSSFPSKAVRIMSGDLFLTRVMTIFVFYVNPQTPTIENFDVYGGLQLPGGISSFFSSNFPSNAVTIMSGNPFLTGVMTIFIKAKTTSTTTNLRFVDLPPSPT